MAIFELLSYAGLLARLHCCKCLEHKARASRRQGSSKLHIDSPTQLLYQHLVSSHCVLNPNAEFTCRFKLVCW